MDSRLLILLSLVLVAIIMLVPLIWIHKSQKRLLQRQDQVEVEHLSQKKILNDVREELNQLREEHKSFGLNDNQLMYEHVSGVGYVDILLTEKKRDCIKKGIDFRCAIVDWPNIKDAREQIVRLIGNLFDNAIEAAEKTDTQKKNIIIESRILKGQWILIVTNSKKTTEHPLEHGMQTTKLDAGIHGLGTQIIDKTVKKMGGFVKRIDEGERFQVRVMVPIEKKKLITKY